MRILHVLSQNELTGAEAYSVALIRRQIEAGHEVTIISDTLTLTLPKEARYVSLPIDRRSLKYRARNIISVRRLIREFRPQVVHAHSRAASWVSRVATFFGPALVSSIHGRQHWHTRYKLNDIYGQRIITICDHLRDHLIDDFGISPKKVDLIRNLVESREYRDLPATRPAGFRLGLFGRMSGPKGEIWGMLLRDVLPDLMAEFPNLEVLIGGGEAERLSDRDRTSLVEFLRNYPDRSKFFGRSPHLATQMADVDYVIGAGRIAIEALYAGKRVFAFGEDQPLGWITRSSIRKSLPSNFGDVGPNRERSAGWPTTELWNQLRTGLRGEIQFDLQADDLRHYFGEDGTIRQIESVYRQAILKKRYPLGIPSLMFHKVVDGPFESQHRTFIHVRRFEKILTYLRGFGKTGVTFAELREACHGERPFPKRPILITFDDGYRNTLDLAAPALKRQGMKAVAYLLADQTVTTNEWDTREYPSEIEAPLLNSEERRALAESGVFEIGSHGLRHTALRSLPFADREFEITESKRLLEAEFGTTVHSFAYAYGNHSARDAELVNRNGYDFAVGTDTHYGLEENLFRIFRANVFPEDGFFSIAKKSNVLYRYYFAAKRRLRSDRRNRTGAFEPVTLRRRMIPTLAALALVLICSPFFYGKSVVASISSYRNVFGEVLEPCLSDAEDGFSFSKLCRSSSLARAPTSICIERSAPRASGESRFECISPQVWTDLYHSGNTPRTIWNATNLRALSRLPAEVVHEFLPPANDDIFNQRD